MLLERTYLDKCATIVKGSNVNTGLNPVSDLLWGRNISRTLIHFNEEKIKSLVESKVYPDINKLRHRLKITNAGSLDMSELHKVYASQIDADKKRRASSFDLIFFLIPEEWDNGKGFDYSKNYLNTEYYNKMSYDYTLYKLKDGVNWYQSRNGYDWKNGSAYCFSKDELIHFYVKSNNDYISGNGDTLTFSYYCKCDETYNNKNIKLEVLDDVMDSPINIGTPIYFANNGMVCESEEHKIKYCKYVQVPVTIPKNPFNSKRKIRFIVTYTIGEDKFESRPYTITQLGKNEQSFPTTDDGIYSTKILEIELNKFNNGEDSIVIGKQHFDIGNENIDIDITNTFNKFITGELKNNGIGIAFAPNFEYSDSLYENYIGLLTNKTNSFFEPFVETTYDDYIIDDRANFIIGKENKLYLYASIGGDLNNLDELPTCSIEGNDYEVSQVTKGVYCVNVKLSQNDFKTPTMLYDKWDNIIYHGEKLSPIEMDFTLKPANSYFKIGTSIPEQNNFVPSVYGISDNENIKRGDVRRIFFLFNKQYEKNIGLTIVNAEARLYIMDGTAQCDVIPYTRIERAFTDNFIMLDTNILIPQKYYMDVRVNYGTESLVHRDVLHFNIVSDTNNAYEL
jgi:hypothetical protein